MSYTNATKAVPYYIEIKSMEEIQLKIVFRLTDPSRQNLLYRRICAWKKLSFKFSIIVSEDLLIIATENILMDQQFRINQNSDDCLCGYEIVYNTSETTTPLLVNGV